MPTSKYQNPQPNRPKRFFQYLWHHPKELIAFIILLALMITLLAIWITTTQNNHAKQAAIAKERAQFTQAEADISLLANQVVAQIGNPDDQVKRNFCGRTSGFNELFPDGELYCNIDIEFAYSVNSQIEARELAAKVESKISGTNQFKPTDPKLEEANNPPVDLGSKDYSGSSGLDCSNGYTYFRATDDISSSGHASLKLKNSNQGLLIELNCSKRPVLTSYY